MAERNVIVVSKATAFVVEMSAKLGILNEHCNCERCDKECVVSVEALAEFPGAELVCLDCFRKDGPALRDCKQVLSKSAMKVIAKLRHILEKEGLT